MLFDPAGIEFLWNPIIHMFLSPTARCTRKVSCMGGDHGRKASRSVYYYMLPLPSPFPRHFRVQTFEINTVCDLTLGRIQRSRYCFRHFWLTSCCGSWQSETWVMMSKGHIHCQSGIQTDRQTVTQRQWPWEIGQLPLSLVNFHDPLIRRLDNRVSEGSLFSLTFFQSSC